MRLIEIESLVLALSNQGMQLRGTSPSTDHQGRPLFKHFTIDEQKIKNDKRSTDTSLKTALLEACEKYHVSKPAFLEPTRQATHKR